MSAPASFTSVDEAMDTARAALGYLARADAAGLPAVTRARLLRELERAESQHTAARARVLAAFTARGGYADDWDPTPATRSPGPATRSPGPVPPGHTAPAAAPGSAAPGSTVPGGTVPGGTVPGGTVPGGTAPGGTAPAAGSSSLTPGGLARLQDTLLRYAISLLSGPAGLAAYLRTQLTGGFLPSPSLPLDLGAPTEQVPPHLMGT